MNLPNRGERTKVERGKTSSTARGNVAHIALRGRLAVHEPVGKKSD